MLVGVCHAALDFEDRAGQLPEIDLFPEELLGDSALDARNAQKVVDEAAKAVDVLLDDRVVLFALVESERIELILGEHADEPLDGSHWGTQLMRGNGDELRLHSL